MHAEGHPEASTSGENSLQWVADVLHRPPAPGMRMIQIAPHLIEPPELIEPQRLHRRHLTISAHTSESATTRTPSHTEPLVASRPTSPMDRPKVLSFTPKLRAAAALVRIVSRPTRASSSTPQPAAASVSVRIGAKLRATGPPPPHHPQAQGWSQTSRALASHPTSPPGSSRSYLTINRASSPYTQAPSNSQ